MTEEREEILLSTVGEMQGLLTRFVKEFDRVSPSFATKSDVSAVDDKMKTHLKRHLSNRAVVTTWLGLVVAIGLGIASIVFK